MNESLWQLPACELAAALPGRQPDADWRWLQACLTRMDAVNPRLNAIIARRDERALAPRQSVRRNATRAARRSSRSTAFRSPSRTAC